MTSKAAHWPFCVTVCELPRSWTSKAWKSIRYSSNCSIKCRRRGCEHRHEKLPRHKRYAPMKPTRLLLIWRAVLLTIGIVLGALRALDSVVPSSLLAINWRLLLALLALAIIDTIR